jgi:flagellar basal body L-ring protein FlgH
MKNPTKQYIASLIATLSMMATAHAEGDKIELATEATVVKTIVHYLVQEGYVVPLATENWYQIDHKKLSTLEDRALNSESRAKKIVDMLKVVIGSEVEIKQIDIFHAQMSTQDMAGVQK